MTLISAIRAYFYIKKHSNLLRETEAGKKDPIYNIDLAPFISFFLLFTTEKEKEKRKVSGGKILYLIPT